MFMKGLFNCYKAFPKSDNLGGNLPVIFRYPALNYTVLGAKLKGKATILQTVRETKGKAKSKEEMDLLQCVRKYIILRMVCRTDIT